MKTSIYKKLEVVAERCEELGALLGDPAVVADNERYRQYSKEYARLEPIAADFAAYRRASVAREQAEQMVNDEDAEMCALAAEELIRIDKRLATLEQTLQIRLLPQDPNDRRNVFLEVRAGTGGDEASLFAGDLFRMYARYAEAQAWRTEIINSSPGEHGGYKEIVARISGTAVYSRLKFESGVHRVQRVPVTESQGRIHTSACTIAVLPEAETVDAVEINSADLRVDTYRASGAGGQHVNRTDSAVRLTHLLTGTVVECQDERSQHKNKARAMSLLQAKLLAAEQGKQRTERAETRKRLVGSGDRSERIRTYNYPQGRVTDHRINLTLYKLDEIIAGELDPLLQALAQEHQANLLAEHDD